MEDKVLRITWYHSDISVTHEVSMAEVLYNKFDDSITCVPEISPSEIRGEGSNYYEAYLDFIKKFEQYFFTLDKFYKELLGLSGLLEHVLVDYSDNALSTEYQSIRLMEQLRQQYKDRYGDKDNE